MKEIVKNALVQAATGLLAVLTMAVIIVGFMWLGAEASEFYTYLQSLK